MRYHHYTYKLARGMRRACRGGKYQAFDRLWHLEKPFWDGLATGTIKFEKPVRRAK